MKFERLNSAFCFNSKTHSGSQIPCPVLMKGIMGDPYIRVFFSARDKENRSNIFYADFSSNMHLIEVHDKPVLDLGPVGTFNDSGCIASQVVIKDGQEFLLYVGVNSSDKGARYRYEHGLASRPLGSDEKFTPLGNILTRSEKYPIGVSMPFYVEYDFDPSRDPNPNNIKPEECQGRREFLYYIDFTKWEEIEGKWEPSYKIEYVELERNEKDFVFKLKHNHKGPIRPDVHYNDELAYPTESCGRPWVWQDGDCLSMLYSSRSNKYYRENPDYSYEILKSSSSNINLDWWPYDEQCNIVERHAGDKMLCYASLIQVPGGDTFLLFNNDFCSSIQVARLVKG